MLANQEQNMSRIGVKHFSKCFKSRLKNIQAAGKKSYFQWSSIDQRSGLTDRKSQKNNFCKILNQV